jgi:hypothetical protein
VAAALEGINLSSANAVAQVFSRKNSRMWIEDADGNILGGKTSPEGRELTAKLWGVSAPPFTLLERDNGGKEHYVTITPLALQDAKARLCINFEPPPQRPDR